MPDMVALICEHNNDRPLFKEILKVASPEQVLRLWRDRQVYPEAFVNGMIADVERTMQEQKKVVKDELPVITFDVDDLYNYAHNKKQLDIWTEKVKEVRTQLDIMFKNSRPPSPEADKPETIELKIKELQKALETCQKYRMHLLKSQAEMIKQMDVAHMRTVLELKKIIEYINVAKNKN